jgi:hypothetical protein
MSNWGNVEHFGPAFNFVLCISILEGDGGKKGGTETQRVVGTREQSVRRVPFPKGVGVIKMQQRAGMVHQFSAERQMENVITQNMLLVMAVSGTQILSSLGATGLL